MKNIPSIADLKIERLKIRSELDRFAAHLQNASKKFSRKRLSSIVRYMKHSEDLYQRVGELLIILEGLEKSQLEKDNDEEINAMKINILKSLGSFDENIARGLFTLKNMI